MARGAPDFWRFAPRGPLTPILDLGELAARLGSIVTFDRRGDVAWLDGFEDGLPAWNTNGTGTGWAVAVGTDRARNGAQSARLTCGFEYSGSAWIYRDMPAPVLGNWGIEVSFAIDANFRLFEIFFDHFTGSRRRPYQVRFDIDSTTLEYRDASGVWQPLATDLDVWLALPFQFHTLKLVVNLSSAQYVRVLFDERSWDLSAGVWDEANTQPPSLSIILRANGQANTNNVVWVDDVIITQNEPA